MSCSHQNDKLRILAYIELCDQRVIIDDMYLNFPFL